MQRAATRKGWSTSQRAPPPNNPSPPATCVPAFLEVCWRGNAPASAWLALGGNRRRAAANANLEPTDPLLPHNDGMFRIHRGAPAASPAAHWTDLHLERSVPVPGHACPASCLGSLQVRHQ